MGVALDTLDYARRLREAGFTEQQAEGQARALAAAMTDALATKQDLHALETRVETRFSVVDARIDALEHHLDTRLVELEKRIELRFAEHGARFDGRLVELERRITFRLGGMLVAAIGTFSALVKLL